MSPRRGHVVLALLVGGGIALAGSSRPWVDVPSGRSQTDVPTIASADAVVTGSQAAPLVTAAALVVLAAAAAIAQAGRVTRWVALVLALLAGLAVVVPTTRVLSQPEQAAAAGLAENSGVVGGFDVQQVEATATAWPVLVVVAGGVVLLASLVGLVRARRWGAVTRFEAPTGRPDAESAAATKVPGASGQTESQAGRGDDWDALTRDEDPTQDRPR